MTDVLQDEMNRLNTLKNRLAFKPIHETIDEIERTLNSLPGQLAELRAGGYVYKNFFEGSLNILAEQWRDQRPLVIQEINTRQSTLTTEYNAIESMHARQASAANSLANMENNMESAERSLEAMVKGLQDGAEQLKNKIKDALWTVTEIKNASFSLQDGEAPYEAVPANWKKPDDKDGVEGVLFLTDHRLLFEQREEVATKKVLFITTAKQKLQSLQWEVPVGAIQGTAASKRGFMNKDDYLSLAVSAGPFQKTEIHLRGESGEAWQKMIEQVRSGAIVQERTGQTLNVHAWGTGQGILIGAAEGIIKMRAAGKVRYQGSTDTAWLTSIIVQRLTDLVGAHFSGRSRNELAAFQSELPGLLKAALAADFQTCGCTLFDIQVDILQEIPV